MGEGWCGSVNEEEEVETSYLGSHLRRQLSFDLWYVFLGFFIIAVSEGSRIADPNQPVSTRPGHS